MIKNSEPTIHDIARELQISASTVSRALNDNPRISLKTKEKIKAVAIALGYRPNTLASNLRNKKSNTIGIVVPLINRHFFSSVISVPKMWLLEQGTMWSSRNRTTLPTKKSTLCNPCFRTGWMG